MASRITGSGWWLIAAVLLVAVGLRVFICSVPDLPKPAAKAGWKTTWRITPVGWAHRGYWEVARIASAGNETADRP